MVELEYQENMTLLPLVFDTAPLNEAPLVLFIGTAYYDLTI